MTTVPLVDLKAQYHAIASEIDQAIERVLRSTNFILGPEVSAFERAFADFCEADHAVGISSGTDALHLALLACGIKPGDEVITSPMTFVATAEAISMSGARPVFCDIDPQTYNLDPEQIERAISPLTRAIIPVHLYGQPADMDVINEVAQMHKLHVIEDAAQAHGARYKGRRVGTLGDVACFSFYPGKNLGAYGDAGAVVTNDRTIADRIRLLRDHGRRDKYEHLVEGFGNRLDALQAAVLRVKLKHLEQWNAKRFQHAARYTERLQKHISAVPVVPAWAEPVWHIYAIQVENRDELQGTLKSAGIATGVHYPIPLHLQPAYRHLSYRPGDFPNAEFAAHRLMSLPIFPELEVKQIDAVVDQIAAVLAPQ